MVAQLGILVLQCHNVHKIQCSMAFRVQHHITYLVSYEPFISRTSSLTFAITGKEMTVVAIGVEAKTNFCDEIGVEVARNTTWNGEHAWETAALLRAFAVQVDRC